MLIIGLTGGIGSGKTTVASLFAEKDIPVIDTDTISRKLTKKGQPGYLAVVNRFGRTILGPDNEIDRARLRAIVFEDETRRQELESLLHPVIKQEVLSQLTALSGNKYCIVVVPLLIEAGYQDIVNRILVVDTPEEKQVERVSKRDSLSQDEVKGIMHAQLSREARLQQADDVIENDGDVTQLSRQIEKLHQYYLGLADTRH